jgi:hypothetical protein
MRNVTIGGLWGVCFYAGGIAPESGLAVFRQGFFQGRDANQTEIDYAL